MLASIEVVPVWLNPHVVVHENFGVLRSVGKDLIVQNAEALVRDNAISTVFVGEEDALVLFLN